MNITNLTLMAAIGIFCATPLVNAAPITVPISIQLRPGNSDFPENTNGNDAIFIIRNISNTMVDVKITNLMTPSAVQLDKNPDDLINKMSLAISDANGCKGTTLKFGDVCAFDVTFNTEDNSGINDGDASAWRLGVQASYAEFVALNPRVGSTAGFGNVNVVDPPADAPEPSSAGLFSLGFVALLIVYRKLYKSKIT